MEIRFYVLFPILNKFGFYSNVPQSIVLPMTRKNATIFLFCVLKDFLITETGGQAWFLHHKWFNQYQPEYFKKQKIRAEKYKPIKEKKCLQDYKNSREVL